MQKSDLSNNLKSREKIYFFREGPQKNMDGLRQIMADLLAPEKAAQATAQMKELKNNQLLLPSLMQIALRIEFFYFFCVFE